MLKVLSIPEGSVFPDYLEVAAAVDVPHGVGKLLPVNLHSVDAYIYNFMRVFALSINSHEHI